MEDSKTPVQGARESEATAIDDPVGEGSDISHVESGGADVESGSAEAAALAEVATPVTAGETPAEVAPRKPLRPRSPARPFVKPSEEDLAELRKRAAEAWETVVAARESHESVSGTVISVVKGGLLVDIGGIRGFLPASQVRAPEGGTLDALVKTVLPLKVLDLDAPRRRAVVSARRALEDLRRAKRAELLRSLAPGQRREGVVVRLTDFGAFVDLGGIDGLIPMSELALERVEKAADVVSVGERLELEVLRVDEGGKKISLSRKSALPDPWRDHADLLKTGAVVEGKVVAKEPRLSIELAPGVVGIMRDSDADPADYEIGETVEVSVRTVDRRARRLTLATPYAAEAARAPSSGFASLGEELRTRALR
jgi:ribosomal protein S1